MPVFHENLLPAVQAFSLGAQFAREQTQNKLFQNNIRRENCKFQSASATEGYSEDLINTTLSEVNFKDRKLAFQQKPKTNQGISPFVTQYQPSVPNLKQILMKNWHLIEQQPLITEQNLQQTAPCIL